MKITDLNGKNICILGYGREGRAMANALEKYAPMCRIAIADQNEKCNIQNTKYKIQLGKHWLENMDQFEVIIKSPGIPPQDALREYSKKITNGMQIFLDSINQDAVVIGVTGSKGKSTTASLIHAILTKAQKDTALVGNIGEPAIAHIQDVSEQTIVVAEMSSFQLQELTRSPQIAVVTSFFPEHIDYHGSIDAYREAKTHICAYQSDVDITFYNAASKDALYIAETSSGKHVPFSIDNAPLPIEETLLLGEHNLSNIAAATLVAKHLGIDDAEIHSALRQFKGLPHRLYNLGSHHGVVWIDDAISTTPESTIAAIKAVHPTTIIVGGKDRGLDFTVLGTAIDASEIKHIIAMGHESGPRIAHTIQNSDSTIIAVSTMEEAVSIAKQSGGTCLLSPASPSHDMYKSFEEKGEDFANEIQKQLAEANIEE